MSAEDKDVVSGEETGPEIKRPTTNLKRTCVCQSRWQLVKKIRLLLTTVSISLDGALQTDKKNTHKHTLQLLPRIPPKQVKPMSLTHTLVFRTKQGSGHVCLTSPRLLQPQFPPPLTVWVRPTPFFPFCIYFSCVFNLRGLSVKQVFMATQVAPCPNMWGRANYLLKKRISCMYIWRSAVLWNQCNLLSRATCRCNMPYSSLLWSYF